MKPSAPPSPSSPPPSPTARSAALPGAAPAHDWALCVGAFQPPQRHTLALIEAALQQARRVVVGLSGAWLAPSPAHPLSWGQRADLIRAALPPRAAERLRFLPLRELGSAERNAQALQQGLAGLCGVAPERVPRLLSPAQASAPGWLLPEGTPRLEPGAAAGTEASDEAALRDLWFNADSAAGGLARLAPWLDAPLRAALGQACDATAYARLRAEWRALRQMREAWAAAPYPPVFVTVDAVLRCAGRVLLIRRARAPGQGLLALPGGFLEQADTLLESALREVQEETRLELPAAEWRAALRGVAVFDAPGRSQRGRTITHAHFFDLGERALPPVQGDDDASEARWVPIEDLPGLETQFFDDHFVVLDHFLGLLSPPAG